MDPVTVTTAAKSYTALRDFVENGELARTLGTIGDVHTKAALASLRSTRFSAHPEREMWSTINHLQGAHAAYDDIWAGDGYSDYSAYVDSAAKDQRVLLLLVLAYQYVGDRPLALRTLEELDALPGRVWKRWALNVVRHPVQTGKRSASFYLKPVRSMKAVVKLIQPPLSDGELAELRADIERMELPAAVA